MIYSSDPVLKMNTTSNPILLELQNMTFGYGKMILFRELSLSIGMGEFVGIIGPNGSGKSTLIKLMAGILKPTEGTIALKEKPIPKWSEREIARSIAYVPQQTQMSHAFSVMDIILMGRYPHRKLVFIENAEDISIARNALATVGAEKLEHHYFDDLSGGEKQRIILAAALAQEPAILLLDEPTSSLDLHYQIYIFNVLKKLNQSLSLSVVTAVHDLNLAARFCNRILLLTGDQHVIDGPTESVLSTDRLMALFHVQIHTYQDPVSGFRYFLPVYDRVTGI